MLAVWRFEGDFTDATGHGNTLTASASAPTFPSTAGLFVEGAQAVQFAAATTQLASCSAGACPTLSQTSNLTWGCWARSDDVATRTFVHKLSGAGGAGSYMAERVFSAAPTAANTLRCTLSNGAATVTSISAATWTATGGVAPYRFAACVFDDTANTVQSFLNAVGGAMAPFPAAMAAQGGPFSVSDATAPWNAQLDECFVDDAAWTPVQLCRAGSCGIDGTLCMCAGALPSTYLACNADSDCRVAGNTTALCNTATHLCTGRNSGGSVDMGGCALPACDAGAP
jgi:hypothetical protein